MNYKHPMMTLSQFRKIENPNSESTAKICTVGTLKDNITFAHDIDKLPQDQHYLWYTEECLATGIDGFSNMYKHNKLKICCLGITYLTNKRQLKLPVEWEGDAFTSPKIIISSEKLYHFNKETEGIQTIISPIIDQSIWITPNNEEPIINLLGSQKHLISLDTFNQSQENALNMVSLGAFRNDCTHADIMLHDTATVYFDINAIRQDQNPNNGNAPICGFSIEEACLIMKYIGNSPNINTINICGLNTETTDIKETKIVNTMLWYYLEGRAQQMSLSHANAPTQEYVIDFEDIDMPLTFKLNQESGRWFFKSPLDEVSVYACHEDDFKMAKENILSNRITKILEHL